MSWKVLVSAPYMLPFPEEFRMRLENDGVEIITTAVRERLSEAELLDLIEEIDGVICGDDQFTERVFERAVKLRVISKWGTGIDSIDTDAAARLGIRVYNTPGAFTDAVADTTLGYILCFARKIPWMDRDIRQGRWSKPQGVSLKECTLGVVGLGNIGQAVTRRARASGMRVLGVDIKTISESFVSETGITLATLSELLGKADFVTLHCDLNPASFHLIGRTELRQMKASAYLINTARGPIIDEEALIAALQNQQIAGAALDVFEIEPLPANSPLREIENCLLAPHNSNSSPAAKQRVHEATVTNLLKGLARSEKI